MTEILRWEKWLTLAIMVAALPFAASAQTFQALPEIDVYYRFNPNVRVFFQAKDTREGGDSTTAEIGPSLDFHLKELSQLSDITTFDLDKSKSHVQRVEIGHDSIKIVFRLQHDSGRSGPESIAVTLPR